MSRTSTALVDRLVRDRVLTRDGRNWLIAAVDPFHDTDLDLKGYPDTNVAASVVQVVKQSITITSNQGASADWDLHIMSLPLSNNMTLGAYASQSNILYNQGASVPVGMLNFAQQASSSTADLNLIATYATLSADASYSSGNSRVIASGYEITNTTAEIYKQGQATVYRLPQPPPDPTDFVLGSFASGALVAVTGAGSLNELRMPPSNTADAFLLSGTRQWAASEGAYMIPTFATANLPPVFNGTSGFFFPDNYDSAISARLASASGGSGALTFFSTDAKHTSQNSTGVFLTGLSAATSLVVTLNVYIEVFPSQLDKPLVVLAKPSPRYDLVAQEMYAECLADMPAGVMVKENGLGDWFKNAVSTVSKWAGPALSAIPHPAAQAIGAGLKVAGGMIRDPAYKAQAPPSSGPVEMYTEEERALVKAHRRSRQQAKSRPLPPLPPRRSRGA